MEEMTKKELKIMYLKTFLTINKNARDLGLLSFGHIDRRLTGLQIIKDWRKGNN